MFSLSPNILQVSAHCWFTKRFLKKQISKIKKKTGRDIKDLKEGKWPAKGWANLSYQPVIGGAEFEAVLRSPDFWKGQYFLLFHTTFLEFKGPLICKKKAFKALKCMKSNFEASRSHRATYHNIRKTKPGERETWFLILSLSVQP